MNEVETLSVRGIDVELWRRGGGAPILLLHGLSPVERNAPFVELVAAHAQVIAPTHPGFGHAGRPDDVDTVYDLVHLYLTLLDDLALDSVTLVGLSFGGWLAAEMAAAHAYRVARLVLVDAVGIKISPPDVPDVFDLFNGAPADVRLRSWHAPEKWAPDYDAMEDDALVAHARNRDALCLYAWQPYMNNPRLARWLGAITVPTLVLWGASDGIVSPAYGRAYAEKIPGARFEVIDGAGHHPEIEQADAFARRVVAFLEEPCRPGT